MSIDWNTVVAYPVVPFRAGLPDCSGFRKNADYLIAHNSLDEGRPRVLGFGGGSLIHHLEPHQQVQLVDTLCQAAGPSNLVVSGIVPNPLASAGEVLAREADLPRPPDAWLVLPVNGIANPEGIYRELMNFCETRGRRHSARFFLYLRSTSQRDVLARVARDCEFVYGVKIGTSVADVRPVLDLLDGRAIAMWGIGDCCVEGVRHGACGHTSGIATLFVRASDELNNAYRRGDWETAVRIEDELAGFERIRFMEDRAYNYVAVAAAAQIGGFTDIDCGEGAPFNAQPPAAVLEQVYNKVEQLRRYH